MIIEDTPELSVEGADVVHLHTSLDVDLALLLRQTLRLTPDRMCWARCGGRRPWSWSGR